MDVLNRIKCDGVRGGWLVLFRGRQITKSFKTSEEALKHLDDLKAGRAQPEYAV